MQNNHMNKMLLENVAYFIQALIAANWVSIGSDNLNQHWLIVNWTTRNKLQWRLIQYIQNFSFMKMDLEMSSAKHMLSAMSGDVCTPWGDVVGVLKVEFLETYYRQFSNIRRTQSPNINVPRLVSLLSLPNPLKPRVKLRMKM